MIDHPSRRSFLGGATAFTAWAAIPSIAAAAGPEDPRFVLLMLRGGLDGLAAVAPVGDPNYFDLREQYALPLSGRKAGTMLDSMFMLNPRLPNIADLYAKGEAMFVHAVAAPMRSRSHFEMQDVVENGMTTEAYHKDGWLGRAVASMPASSKIAQREAFAAATTVPLTLRGAPETVTWMPAGMRSASDDLRERLLALYDHTDPVLASIMSDGIALDGTTGGEVAIKEAIQSNMMGMQVPGPARQTVAAASAAGRALAADDGPRIGFLDMPGFDTHRQQAVVDGRLGQVLSGLDTAVAALRRAMGPAWSNTIVVVVTEFGRTARINGTRGTDHGTATVAMLLGGAVAGQKVMSDWPGVSERALYEGRDLAPTTDVRGVFKGVLRDHLGIDRRTLAQTVFPDSAGIRPLDGLVRTGRG